MMAKLTYIILQMHIPMGDYIIYFNNKNIVHTSELYINGRYPFIDYYSTDGFIEGIIAGLEKIISIIDN